jgi:hypothetical protein
MKDDERNKPERGAAGVEEALAGLVPVKLPAGLRGRVLCSGLAARKEAALTPGMRVAAAAGASIILAVLWVDPLLGRQEAARLAAVLDGRLPAPAAGPAPELAEVLACEPGEGERLVRLQALARQSVREEIKRDFIKARKGLKGWLENETSEDPD